MDKKVSIKNIDKIIKNNRYEEVEVSYPCGEEEITFSVIPCADYAAWYEAIETSANILVDDDGNYRPQLTSAAYGLALVSCFTNIKTDNANKIIELTMITDIVDLIEDALPGLMLKNFKSDFELTRKAKESEGSPLGRLGDFLAGAKELINNIASMPEEDLQKLFGNANITTEG